MAEKEILLMKGNEAIAHAAIRCGCDAYFGYPITPQSGIHFCGMPWCSPYAGGNLVYGRC